MKKLGMASIAASAEHFKSSRKALGTDLVRKHWQPRQHVRSHALKPCFSHATTVLNQVWKLLGN